MINVNWHDIRPLRGSQADGFEEFCAQLARTQIPDSAKFTRKGTPDAGVECFATLENGNEWGWQAKYFMSLADSQWAQIDKSVKTAIEKHPRLEKYFVCVPLDRPDARRNDQKSALEKWNEHKEIWEGLARANSMEVEFVWQGSFELLDILAKPENRGRIQYWFNLRFFDDTWFQERLDSALKTAGPRYTPELNVSLPINSYFEAISRTDAFFARVKGHAKSIRSALGSLKYGCRKIKDTGFCEQLSTLHELGEAAILGIAELPESPCETLPIDSLLNSIDNAYDCAISLNEKLNGSLATTRNADAGDQTVPAKEILSREALRESSECLHRNAMSLHESKDTISQYGPYANCPVVLLTGEGGTGKTHLLCDIARLRVEQGCPTLLLMGQAFTSTEEPWTQVLQQLDMRNCSADEVVGALEAAAQAADSRAVVFIDALNEGQGRHIWPNHLAAFLSYFKRSSWITVVISVRSSYEPLVIPEAVRAEVVGLVHHGFYGSEYDAAKTFFGHYGLELPSTPLLAPEFSNPLFLKVLCKGLSESGQHRLPRGFHGITATFDLYLSSINERLAKELNYNPKLNLINEALQAFATMLVDRDSRWLTLKEAMTVVNAQLSGREFDQSLYRGLVSEGLLVEEPLPTENAVTDEVVFIGYERLADHLVANLYLDKHLNVAAPIEAFAENAPLSFLSDMSRHISPGLLEAISIQIPERTGKELLELAPALRERWGYSEAFRNSLVWRASTAFSEMTTTVMNDLIRTNPDYWNTIEVLLTVASIPRHPLNADYLNARLRKDTMPERDAWWSTYLHRAWGEKSAVDRLVDWASGVEAQRSLDDDATTLCASVLTWMFTSSNRCLRDRSTKALINLLNNREHLAPDLVEKFHDVDDAYLLERLYAVMYGVAMRSHDAAAISNLATVVYEKVFAKGEPPAQILLRDYARGIVERAIFLGTTSEFDVRLIRPPYNSLWPTIPSEADIAPLIPNVLSESSEQRDWARYKITNSVLDDDFARYVIGRHSEWLSVPLTAPLWYSPEERLAQLVDSISQEERDAWFLFKEKERHLLLSRPMIISIKGFDDPEDSTQDNDLAIETTPDYLLAENEVKTALSSLESVLTEENTLRLNEVLDAEHDEAQRRVPHFEQRLIQRYIVWRVFDLGWTSERFGQFDRQQVHSSGRSAQKAERIGKKYQWIAYHEIMALISDHFQFRDGYGEECVRVYDGPWQTSLRDIDPSNILRSTPGGTKHDGHAPAWWAPVNYENWKPRETAATWVQTQDDLPAVPSLIRVQSPVDGKWWLNLNGYFEWEQGRPHDKEFQDVERRDLWYIFDAYVIKKDDQKEFMDWAAGVCSGGRWMPEVPTEYRMFLGEYGWLPAAQALVDAEAFDPLMNCPIQFSSTAFEFLEEVGTFDCSIDDTFKLSVPDMRLLAGLNLRWSGFAADFVDQNGTVVAFDPTAREQGPSSMLVREDELRAYLNREGLTLVWAVIGEKQAFGQGFHPNFIGELSISGSYSLQPAGVDGFLNLSPRLATDETEAAVKDNVGGP